MGGIASFRQYQPHAGRPFSYPSQRPLHDLRLNRPSHEVDGNAVGREVGRDSDYPVSTK